jgi:Ser/Thr protein kinase RdoA (MazF antagonist)
VTVSSAPVEGLDVVLTMPGSLRAIADPARLVSAFSTAEPALSGDAFTLDSVVPRRVRLLEGVCTATYELGLRDAMGNQRIVAVHGRADLSGRESIESERLGEFGTPGWRCPVPELRLVLFSAPADVALPSMKLLEDPVRARALLEEAIRTAGDRYRDLRIVECTPTVARYKPGSRCTIVYRLTHGPEARGRGWPTKVIAKTYRGDKGRTAFSGMSALWNSNLRTSDVVTIAEPLAFLDERNVLLQGPVPGTTTLKELLRAALGDGDERIDDLHSLTERTGRGLAALHRCGARGGPARWQDQMTELRGRVGRLGGWFPPVARELESVLGRLEDLSDRIDPRPPVPSHGSFRPAQVLVEGNTISFIDFDGFREAEPAMDLALFTATTKSIGIRLPPEGGTSTRLDELDELRRRFLDAYGGVAPVARDRTALWETVYLLMNLMNCWTKVRPGRLDGALLLLRRHIEHAGLPVI